MKHRLFVAIPISDTLKPLIAEFRNKYRDLPVRWLDSGSLHLTLIPPWYAENTAEIVDILSDIRVRQPMIEIKYQTVSLGPDPASPRLIWAIGYAPETVLMLKTELEKALNFPSNSRNFLPHLTLGRFNKRQVGQFPLLYLNEKISWSDNIFSYRLMESYLEITGARYETLAEYNFG